MMASETAATKAIETRLYINNTFVTAKSGETIALKNPADDSHVADVQVAGPEDVEAAVAAASAALKGEWSIFSGAQRQKCLMKFADLLEEHGNEVAYLDTITMGTPISFMKYGFYPLAAAALRHLAGYADKIQGESFKDDGDGFYKIVEYAPVGVCAAIGTWNATPLYFAYNVAGALAAGNTLIYKASEKAPFASLALAPLIAEAGFPPGVLNIISGAGSTGALLASHPKIRLISFVGSAPTGKKVLELAAQSNLKRVILELGGKAPAIVFEDADMDNAVVNCADNFLRLTAQICIATTRLLLHKSIAKDFIERVKGRFEELSKDIGGDPMNPTTTIGPLADARQLSHVLAGIEGGKKDATLIVGGERKGDKGCFITPALFVDPVDEARIYKDEVFGPVIIVKTFETEEEAIEMANDTEYGLYAAIFTGNVGRAMRVARKVEAGIVVINSSGGGGDVQSAFGGMKGSGIGRVGGKYSIMSFLEPKTIKLNMAI